MGIAGALVLGCAAAFAGPLQRGDVPAEPVWVVHVDIDGLRPTSVGQYLLAEAEKPENQAKLAAFQAVVSFDLRTQLHGLTLYSIGSTPQDGVLLVYADFDAERLRTLALGAPEAQSTTYKQMPIYSWIDKNKKTSSGTRPRTYAAIYGSRVIFGQREERVAQALDVITGASANFAATKAFPQLGAPGNPNFLQAAARKMDFAQSDPNAQVLRLSKQASFQAGQAGQQITANVTLEANDEEVANNIHSILNGLLSLLKLQKEKPESVKFAEALSLKQTGPVVQVNFTMPVAEVIGMMKADAARKAAKKAEKK